jgi:hypothetical protein
MSAEIVDLHVARAERKGNGAREALIDVPLQPRTADWLLIELWVRGFKVVPIEGGDE